jgi:hypothetical protein
MDHRRTTNQTDNQSPKERAWSVRLHANHTQRDDKIRAKRVHLKTNP